MYTDYDQVQTLLKDPRFTIVDDPKKAKILWLSFEYEAGLYKEW